MDEGRAEVLGWMWTRHSSSRPPFLAPDENTALLEEGIAKGDVREVWRAIFLNSISAMMSFQLKNNVKVWASRAWGQQPGWGETAAKWKVQSVEGHGGKPNQNNPEERWLKTLEFSVSMKIPRKWRGGRRSNPGQGFHSSAPGAEEQPEGLL